MSNGRNLEEGNHKELLKADGLYARLYRLQREQENQEAEA